MQFGSALGEACATFAVTNIDDIFVLVTFFAEATTSPTLTPVKITIGQYAGFTIIMVISMIGYAVALVLPAEPIGFLGLLPILLGLWKGCGLLLPSDGAGASAEDGAAAGTGKAAGMRSILKVTMITLMNGGDNIGTYIPLFSQLEGAEIAVYVVTYYILLGVWCVAAWLIMKQKHILRAAQKYTDLLIPFLYVGLGTYIVVKSDCYPWTIEQIDESTPKTPGRGVMGGVTAFILLASIGAMIWFRWSKRASRPAPDGDVAVERTITPPGEPACDARGDTAGDNTADESTAEKIRAT